MVRFVTLEVFLSVLEFLHPEKLLKLQLVSRLFYEERIPPALVSIDTVVVEIKRQTKELLESVPRALQKHVGRKHVYVSVMEMEE